MELPPFELERWLDRYETDAEVMLGESGIRSLPAERFDLDPGDLGYVIPTDGDPDLRAAVAGRHGRTAEEVVLTCGTQEANFLAIAALLERGGHAVVVEPVYQSLASLPAAFGRTTSVDLEPPTWDLDPDAVADALEPDTRAIVLANPGNPTGTSEGESTLRALAEVAADAGAHLLVDEVYRMLVDDPAPPAASIAPHATSTGGVSKAYGLAGARIGWAVADPELADAIRRVKDYTTISPPIVGQHVARQALGPMEAGLLRENRELAAENRELVGAFVERHGLEWAEPATVVGFPTVPDGFDGGEAFCRAVFEETGVLLAPGECFGRPDRFRIGFGTATGTLEEGLDRVERLLA